MVSRRTKLGAKIGGVFVQVLLYIIYLSVFSSLSIAEDNSATQLKRSTALRLYFGTSESSRFKVRVVSVDYLGSGLADVHLQKLDTD